MRRLRRTVRRRARTKEESARTTRNACLLKRRYWRPIDRRGDGDVDVASASVDNNLLRFSVKGYFYRRGCVGCVGAMPWGVERVGRYDSAIPRSGFAQADAVGECARAMEDGDGDAFSRAVAEFDSMSRLDAWKTTVLSRRRNGSGGWEEERFDRDDRRRRRARGVQKGARAACSNGATSTTGIKRRLARV